LDIDGVLIRAKEAAGVKKDNELASLLGLSSQAFNNRKRRGTLFPLIAEWAAKEGINVTWILTGEGEMFPTPRRGLVQVDPPPAIQRLKRFIEVYGPSETGDETQGVPPPGQPDRYRHLEAYRATGPPAGISDEEWQLICNYRCAGDEIKEECFGMLERSAAKSRAKDGGGSDSPEMKSG